MGAVKAAEALVYAAVMDGKYGNSIPFFGFERQGAPVTAFVRISEEPIRPKKQGIPSRYHYCAGPYDHERGQCV